MSSNVMTLARLEAFNDAWSRGDIPTLMSFMTDDCIYQASVGPEPGRTFRGRADVEAGFRNMLQHDSGGESKGGRCAVMGDIGVAEWSYIHTIDGVRTEVRGCDMFEFAGDKIRRKDAFRKSF